LGSFLPFAALWLKVRSISLLGHSTITPPRLSQEPDAEPLGGV
jgi:hypothetical protein